MTDIANMSTRELRAEIRDLKQRMKMTHNPYREHQTFVSTCVGWFCEEHYHDCYASVVDFGKLIKAREVLHPEKMEDHDDPSL